VKQLQNQTSHFLFLFISLKKFQNLFVKIFWPIQRFIMSKRQSSLRNIFYDRNQTLQAEVISDIVGID